MDLKIQFLEESEIEANIWYLREFYWWFLVHGVLLFERRDSLNTGFKLCVPKSQIRKLVLSEHVHSCHFGKAKVYAHMKETFYYSITLDNSWHPASSLRKPSARSAFTDPYLCGYYWSLPASCGVSQLLVVLDAFTKYVFLYALKRATTKTVLGKLLNEYFTTVQKHKCILSDPIHGQRTS